MLKIGIKSSAYFYNDNYEDGLLKVKAHGYDCIDYQGLVAPESPFYLMNDNEFDKYFVDLKKFADRAGVNIWQMHGMWPHDDTTNESRENVIQRQKKALRAAAILDCKYFVIHPAMPNGWSAEPSLSEVYKVNEERFAKLIPYAKQNGTVICLENMPFSDKDHSFSSVKSIKDFVKKINDDNFKICLDTGHCHVTRDSLYDAIIAVGDDLKALHVHDAKYGHDLHLLPYEGELDWSGFVRGLREINFDGCLSLETCVGENTPNPMKEEMEKSLFKIIKHLADLI